MAFVNLHCHDFFSTLDGLGSPEANAKRAASLGQSAIATTNHGNVGSIVKAEQAAKNAGIKNINGIEYYLSPQHSSIKDKTNGKHSHLVVLAKNKEGWKNILHSVAQSNRNFYSKARLSLDELAEYAQHGNLITFSGHPGSDMANILFRDINEGYGAKTREQAVAALDPDHLKKAVRLAEKYRDIFGADNFSLEGQRIDHANFAAADVILEILREVSNITGIPVVATADCHYPAPEAAIDQRVILCSAFGTTLSDVRNKIANDEDVSLGAFFRSNKYYIPGEEEMLALHKGFEREVHRAGEIADMCEPYSVLSLPRMPRFDCPGGISPEEYIRDLAREGWREKIAPIVRGDAALKQVYADRIKNELDMFLPINLASYFLIVRDYINYAVSIGEYVGKARGSSAGCLLSYLINVTRVNPIPHKLLSSRFYNPGRNSPGRIALPDIDTDFSPAGRDKVEEYCRKQTWTRKCRQGSYVLGPPWKVGPKGCSSCKRGLRQR
jgi:DNA polymerase-3 subunit alpha